MDMSSNVFQVKAVPSLLAVLITKQLRKSCSTQDLRYIDVIHWIRFYFPAQTLGLYELNPPTAEVEAVEQIQPMQKLACYGADRNRQEATSNKGHRY